MNKLLLKSAMVKHGDTQAKLAAAMGISESRLNAKINERDGAEFMSSEMNFIKARYGLSASEASAIFFA